MQRVPAGECTPQVEEEAFRAAIEDSIEIGPGTYVLTGDGSSSRRPGWSSARARRGRRRRALRRPPRPLENLPHQARVLAGLFLLAVLPGLLAAPFFGLRDTPSRLALIPGTSIVLTLLAGIGVLAVWRGPLTDTKAWAVVAVAVGAGAGLRFGAEPILRALRAFGGFFDRLFSQFSNVHFATLMGVQFLTQAGQGVIQGAIGKSIAFGGQQGFDVQNVPSADYLLQVILALYVPYTLISPFIGVVIDRFQRRRVVWWTNVLTAAVVVVVAARAAAAREGLDRGERGRHRALIVGLLASQAVVRVALAVKSAAIPDVLSGKDLLQGNALSQAGGAFFQIVGIAVALAGTAVVPAWVVVVAGAGVLLVGAVVATPPARPGGGARDHVRPGGEAGRQHRPQDPRGGVATGGGRRAHRVPDAPIPVLGLRAVRVRALREEPGRGRLGQPGAALLSGVVGLIGGVLGLLVAQAWKDRVPPIRLLLGSMVLLGVGTIIGGIVSVPAFAAMLFLGFLSFFVGKIAADTIVQQAIPDDFRGRAFALFDIAYNLGFIVPALILSFVWIEDDPARTRTILLVSGVVFLALTAAVAAWARRLRDGFAPQDDLIEA